LLLGLVAVVPAQAPAAGTEPEVVRWIAETARPLASLEPGADAADLEPLRAIVGKARIVALGEATHGSHEFFAFKRRALEFLVRELGFTDFAMETDWTAALAANDYVEHGRGDLDGAVRALSPLWRTEEYRGLLEWLRAWNADPTHTRKVRFHGLDLAAAGPTARRLGEYLARVDPDVADSVAPVIERFENGQMVDEADREGLLALLDELRDACVELAGEREWEIHRQHLVALTQVAAQRAKRGHDATSFRDRCMADNARWILRTAGPGARLVLSAHNGHVSRAGMMEVEGYGTIESIGRALAADAEVVTDEDLSLVVIGTAFGQGRFHAYGRGLQAFELGPPRAEAHEALLSAAGLELALLDLGSAPADGPVRAWLTTPRPLRFVGGAFDPASAERGEDVLPCTLAAEFDALFFSAGSSPSRLLEPPR
ncbi:MAG TPA: erythromycin esterase family protein, partial [Planctomycetota bacterium]